MKNGEVSLRIRRHVASVRTQRELQRGLDAIAAAMCVLRAAGWDGKTLAWDGEPLDTIHFEPCRK